MLCEKNTGESLSENISKMFKLSTQYYNTNQEIPMKNFLKLQFISQLVWFLVEFLVLSAIVITSTTLT